jgi:D-glycero-alpha-D-manno-heptose-7-phosphate kinase
MELRISAPNRIDLAGGTTDICPLYLFMGGGFTVNVAVTVRSNVVLRRISGQSVRIISHDLKESVEATDPSALPVKPPLGLIARAVRAFPPGTGIEITTRNEAPSGSGLGASSALLVALLTGLHSMRREHLSGEDTVEVAANIEAAEIGVPTGMQDHIAAFYGGVSAINFGYRGFERTPCCTSSNALQWLESTMILSYTGSGRFSGMNNWDVTKAFIDNNVEVRAKLVEIRDIAREVGTALHSGRWEDVPELVDREWRIRRSLAPGISNSAIEGIMNAARAAGASASKICGAGGGGCMVTLTPPHGRASVEKAISDAGGQVLQFRIDTRGVRWSESPE